MQAKCLYNDNEKSKSNALKMFEYFTKRQPTIQDTRALFSECHHFWNAQQIFSLDVVCVLFVCSTLIEPIRYPTHNYNNEKHVKIQFFSRLIHTSNALIQRFILIESIPRNARCCDSDSSLFLPFPVSLIRRHIIYCVWNVCAYRRKK